MSKLLYVERIACPRCQNLKPRVTLLTSYLVFVECAACNHAWELRPEDYPPVHRNADVPGTMNVPDPPS